MKIILGIALFIIIFLVSIRYIERHSIFYPMKEIPSTPEAAGLLYEDVYFKTSDNKLLNGWFIPNENAKLTLLFCHGNAGSISHRLEKILIFHNQGLNVFIFDYRGYGKSQGSPSERGLYKDSFAALSYLTDKRGISKDDIILYGESLGGAVAIDLASKVKLRALITEETFTSIKDLATIAYPFMPKFIFSSKFNAIDKIKEVESPKLIIHSTDDEIVPFYLGEKLFNAAKSPKEFLKIRGSHNTAFFDSDQKFKEGIRAFLNSL